MRTKLFLAALAGVALASCVTDKEYVETNPTEGVKIVFDSPVLYNNTQTRANVFGEVGTHQYGPVTYSYPKEELFKIFGIQYTGSFAGWAAEGVETAEFNDTAIAYDNNVDGWAPKKYVDSKADYYHWPIGKNMAFAAYSPANLNVSEDGYTSDVNKDVVPTYGANGLTIEDFTVIPNAAYQYDLLFSQRAVDMDANDMTHGASYYSGIPIQFQHALTSIRFSLQNTSNAEVIIKGIKLYGVKSTGDFNENITEGTNPSAYNRGEGGNVNPQWTGHDNVITKDNAYNVFYIDGGVDAAGGVVAPYEAQYLSVLLEDNANTGTFHQLLLLPQAITADAKVEITYTINGSKNVKEVKLADALKVNPDPSKADETLNETLAEWKMGTRYTYRLWYSEESASKDRIYFSPSTDNWLDAGAYKIEL